MDNEAIGNVTLVMGLWAWGKGQMVECDIGDGNVNGNERIIKGPRL